MSLGMCGNNLLCTKRCPAVSCQRKPVSFLSEGRWTVGVFVECWKTITRPECSSWIRASLGRGCKVKGSRHVRLGQIQGQGLHHQTCLSGISEQATLKQWVSNAGNSHTFSQCTDQRESHSCNVIRSDNSTNEVPKAITFYTQTDKQ